MSRFFFYEFNETIMAKNLSSPLKYKTNYVLETIYEKIEYAGISPAYFLTIHIDSLTQDIAEPGVPIRGRLARQ